MSAGRSRLEIGTYGDISAASTPAGTIRAEARFRDWDGEVRKVTAVGPTVKAAKQALRQKLARRNTATGFGMTLSPESTVAELAAAWLEDIQVRTDLADGTKDLYAREVNSLILPHLKSLRLREVTVGRIDQFIKRQATVSYAHAKHSRRMVSMMFNFRRTSGTVIARATDAKTAAEVMGNTEDVAQRHYIEPEAPVPHTAPAIHLKSLAPRIVSDAADDSEVA